MDPSSGRISTAVRVNGELGSTVADLPPDALFPVYSITKTLTAICVLRLVEIGALRLGDSARQWLAALNVPPEITLTQLLRHTSGLPDYGPLPEYHKAVRAHPDKPWTREQFLDAVLSKGLLFSPGESWSYSNIGYMLLIDVVEYVTGQTFARVLSDLVVNPLALPNTFVVERLDDLMRCVPGLGSEVTADGQVVDVRGRYHPGWCAPRLVASTAEDVTQVFDELIAGNILGSGTLAQMLTLVPLPGSHGAGTAIAGGMGVYSDQASRRGRNYGHGGGGPGYDLDVTLFSDTPIGRVSIAVFVSSSVGHRARDINAALVAQLLDGASPIARR